VDKSLDPGASNKTVKAALTDAKGQVAEEGTQEFDPALFEDTPGSP